MTEQDLKALLAAEISQALGHSTGDLSDQRAEAMDYYLGDMSVHLPAAEGRSKVVSSDVQDTVESIMPSMMEIFTGGDEACRFNAQGPEDEPAAEQETDYINHVFYQECSGFLVLHDFIKDTILQKNGIVKRWWEKSEKFERETYVGLDDNAYQMLLADPDLEQIEYTLTPQGHDATFKRSCKYGKLHCESVPPDEFLISKEAKSIKDARYVGQKTRKTESDLIAMGFPKAKVKKLPSWSDTEDQEQRSRRTTTDETDYDAPTQNKAMRLIEIVESYVKVDWDGDGLAEMRKITSDSNGSVILDNEPADEAPFAGAVGIRIPHRFIGRSIADLTMEIQKINTVLTRQLLDNTYLVTSSRVEIPDTAVNEHTYDDLLTVRPGGLIRTKAPGMMREIVTPPIAQYLLPAIEYFNSVKEKRTGVTSYNQGLDAESLNKTASGISQILSQAQMRMRLLARMIAETGVRDLFLGIHSLIQKHDRKKHVVRLRNKWVEVDPSQWKTRTDLTISVALGSGSKAEQIAFLQNLLNIQKEVILLQGGAEGPLVTLSNVHNTIKELVKNAGMKSSEQFITDPQPKEGQPPPPPKKDPKLVEAEAQAEIKKGLASVDAEIKQKMAEVDIAIEVKKAEAQIQIDAMKADAELANATKKTDAEIANTNQKESVKGHYETQAMERKANEPKNAAVKVNIPDAAGPAIAEAISQAVAATLQTALTNLPPLKVQMPKMKRTPQYGPDGRIAHAIDEPIDEMMQ